MADHHRRSDEQIAQAEQALLTDDPSFLEEIVQNALQQILEAEMTQHVGAAPYERTDERRGQRNGYKPRTLRTRVGTLNLFVPQDREGTFSTQLFARYLNMEELGLLAERDAPCVEREEGKVALMRAAAAAAAAGCAVLEEITEKLGLDRGYSVDV